MNRTMRLLVLAVLCTLGMVDTAVPQSATATPPTYNIELIVFRNGSGTGGGEEWGARSSARGGDSSGPPAVGRFVASIPAAQYQLNDLKARLSASGTYQPVAHFAWQQTPSSWGSRAGFQIQRLAGNVPGLSGMIYLERGQFLHLGMSLNYTPGNPPGGLGATSGTTFNLTEIRRIKFFERNYYDHPAFGVIALVTPANRPQSGR
jgi:Peptidoglycan-binding protein, CsiV